MITAHPSLCFMQVGVSGGTSGLLPGLPPSDHSILAEVIFLNLLEKSVVVFDNTILFVLNDLLCDFVIIASSQSILKCNRAICKIESDLHLLSVALWQHSV